MRSISSRRQHAGPDEEVIQQRDLVALDVDARVVGRGAADDQRAQPERRARHAGQVLHDAQRIAERARDDLQLRLRQLVARHRRRRLARAHGGLVGRRRRSSGPGSRSRCGLPSRTSAAARSRMHGSWRGSVTMTRMPTPGCPLTSKRPSASVPPTTAASLSMPVRAVHDDGDLGAGRADRASPSRAGARSRSGRPGGGGGGGGGGVHGRGAGVGDARRRPPPPWERSAACTRSGSPPACRRSPRARTGTASPPRARPRRTPARPAWSPRPC